MKLKDIISKKESRRQSVISIYDPIKEVNKSVKLSTDSYDSYLEDLDKNKLERDVNYDDFYELVKKNMKDDKDEIRTKWNELSKNMLEPTKNNSAFSADSIFDSTYSKEFNFDYSSSSPIDFNFGIPSFNIYDLPPNVKLLDFRPAFDWRCYRGSMHRQIFPGIPCRFEIVWCSRDFCWHTPYWRRWRLRWRRHCRSVRYPCGVRISTLGRVGLVNASFPRKRIYHFPGLSMKCDSKISTSGKIKARFSTNADVTKFLDSIGIFNPKVKAQLEGKTIETLPVNSSDELPKSDPEPEAEPQAEPEATPEPEPVLPSETISFVDVRNGPISTVEDYLNTNYSNWKFNLEFANPYYGHVTDQYLSSPTTDDAFVVWTAGSTGIISFTAYDDGEVTVVYGCTYPSESVKLIKNDDQIDETTEVKKSFTFDVKKDDIIKIQEVESIIAIYSLTLTPSSQTSTSEPESTSTGYVLNTTNYNSSDVTYSIRNTKFGDYLELNDDTSFVTRDTLKHEFITEQLLKYEFPITDYEYIVIGTAHGQFLTFMGNGIVRSTSTGGKGYTTDMLMRVNNVGTDGFFTLQSVSTGDYICWNSNVTVSAVENAPNMIQRGNEMVDTTKFRTFGGKPPIRYETQWYWSYNRDKSNKKKNNEDNNETDNTAHFHWYRPKRRRKRRVRVYGLLDRMAGKAALMFYDNNNPKNQRVLGWRPDGTSFWRTGIYGWEMFNIVGLSGMKKQDDVGYQGVNQFKITNNGSNLYYIQHNQSGLYMTSSGGTRNESEAELFEIVQEGDSSIFNIKTQNNKYLTFEGLSVKTRDTNNGFGSFTINKSYVIESTGSSIANSIDLSTIGKIFDRLFDNGFNMKEFISLVKWLATEAAIYVKFSITSWRMDFGFQLNTFGVYWGSKSLFGVQNIGDTEGIDLLGDGRSIDLYADAAGIQGVFNFGTYTIGELANAGDAIASTKGKLLKLILKCAKNELNKTNLSSGRKNTINTVVNVLNTLIDVEFPNPGLGMILGSADQEVSFAGVIALGEINGMFLLTSAYISVGSLKSMIKTFLVDVILGPIRFMVKYARINVGWLWRHMPHNVRASINWLNRHIDWANRVFLQYLTQGVTLALRGIDKIPLPNIGKELLITAPIFGVGFDVE